MNITPRVVRLALARRSLSHFARLMMPAFEVAPVHGITISYLEKLLAGEITKLAIIQPPRHGKSLLGSMMAPAFALGRDPKETIITASYGADLSEGWGRRVRNLLNDPTFQEVFPACRLSPDSAAAYAFETTAGGGGIFVGRGGPVTGRGASLLILDDLLKDSQEANSETTCASTIEWLQSTAMTRLTPGGRVLAIGTRWSEKDPLGFLMAQDGWTVLHLSALAEVADPLGRKIGEALWPHRYSVQILEKIRADIGSRVFQCLYQGNTSAAQGTIFKRPWFQHYEQRPEKIKRIVQSWDTSFKTGRTNDYSVCVTIGETATGFYLLSLWRDKVEFPELKRQVAIQADAWNPSEILIEDAASGQSLVQELKTATNYPVIAVKSDRDKESRAAATTGYYEAGRVLFPKDAPWLPDLEDELAGFPGGLHDDQVDAISQALNRLRDTSGGLGLVDLLAAIDSGKRKIQDLFSRTPAAVGSVGPAIVEYTMPANCRRCGQSMFDPSPMGTPPQYRCLACSDLTPAIAAGSKVVSIEKKRRCPNCKSECLWDRGPHQGFHCNDCSCDFDSDGNILSAPAESEDCDKSPTKMHVWREIPGNQKKCDYCAEQRYIGAPPNMTGMSRTQYATRNTGFRQFGQVGR